MSLILVLVGGFALGACSNPEADKKARLQTMEKFVTTVVKHLYDKNPETVRESMTALFREELTDGVREKLQREKQLPNTELGIVKILTEAEENKTTNVVDVTSVKPIGDVDKVTVPFAVSGQVTTKTEGKPDQVKPFAIHIACRLDKVRGAWPQVVDVTGMVPDEPKKKEAGESKTAKKKKRKRH